MSVKSPAAIERCSPFHTFQMTAIRSGESAGKGRSSTLLTTLKIAAVPPIPSASVISVISVEDRFLCSWRAANRISLTNHIGGSNDETKIECNRRSKAGPPMPQSLQELMRASARKVCTSCPSLGQRVRLRTGKPKWFRWPTLRAVRKCWCCQLACASENEPSVFRCQAADIQHQLPALRVGQHAERGHAGTRIAIGDLPEQSTI